MKLLLINSVCGSGSTGRICTDIQSVLQSGGDSALICYGRGSAPKDCLSYKTTGELDVKIHGALSRISDRHGLYSKSATKRLVEKIKEYDPDVINLHNLHGYYLNYKILFEYLASAKKPVVWTLHDCWSFTGHCAHFYDNGCDGWKSGCKKCRFLSAYPKTVGPGATEKNFEIKKKLFTSVNNMILVSPSEWLAGLARESFLGKYEVRVINNGIDLDTFRPTVSDFREKYGLENKKIILGVSNVWSAKKGLNTFNRLAEDLPEKFKIVLVGIPEELKAGISDKIIKIGRTENAGQLAGIYSAADVFVNPTMQDNFPTVNIESMACGTPVITYNSGGSGESITEGTGKVINRGDYGALRDSVTELEKLGFDREKCAERAKLYDRNLKFMEYKKLYDGLSQGNTK